MSISKALVLLVLTCGLAASSTAQAEDRRSLVATIKLDDAGAKERGLAPKTIDLGPAAISFRSYIPADAIVETAPVDDAPEPPPGIGKINVAAKIRLAKAPIEATLTAFHLAAPAAATRVCDWGLGDAGFEQVDSVAAPDLAEAQVLGFKTDDNGRRTQGALIACFTRGDRLLTIFIGFDLRQAKGKEEVARIVDGTRDFAGALLSNLVFADGKPSGYGTERMSAVDALVGDDRLTFAVPKVWSVAINDFGGALPAELHLVRESDGKTRGVVFLSVADQREQPNLDSVGPKFVQAYFARQTTDAKPPKLTFIEEDPFFKAAGIASRSMRFSVETNAGEDGGDILAAVYWREGRLYVASYWSELSPTGDRGVFFSRLPGLTAYDLMRMTLLNRLSSKTP